MFVISSFSWFMRLKFIPVESSFLTWKGFQFIICFYLTIISDYFYFLINLKDIKDHV